MGSEMCIRDRFGNSLSINREAATVFVAIALPACSPVRSMRLITLLNGPGNDGNGWWCDQLPSTWVYIFG